MKPTDQPSSPTMAWRLDAVAIPLAYLGLVVAVAFLHGFLPWKHMPGLGLGEIDWDQVDWNVHYWGIWAYRQVFTGVASPFHTMLQFYPTGLDTITIQGDLGIKLMGGLLSLALPARLTWLVLCLLVPWGSSVGAYALARTLGLSRVPAFASGLVLGLSSATAFAINTGNLENGFLLWFCLHLVFVVRACRQGGKQNAVLGALFGALTVLSNLVFAHHLVLVSGVLVLAHARSLDRRRALSVAALALLTALALAPLLLIFTGAAHPNAPSLDGVDSLRVALENSTPLRDLLPLPESRHQAGSFLPLSAWGLTLLALLASPRRRQTLPWVALLFTFLVLSLGPELLWRDEFTPLHVTLPYTWLHNTIPLYANVRFPHRLVGLAGLALAMLAGFGVEAALHRTRGRARQALALLLPALLLGESAVHWPLRHVPLPLQSPLYRRLAAEPGKFALIDLPSDFGPLDARYLYFQTTHGRPIMGGCVPRYQPKGSIPAMKLVRHNELLLVAFNLQAADLEGQIEFYPVPDAGNTSTLSSRDLDQSRRALARLGFRYLLLHKQVSWEPRANLSLPPHSRLDRFLRRVLGTPRWEDERVAVFPLVDRKKR